ncbi:DedA family protein [Halococcus agarilyticus]|uniref:DedA family protein n=1 Tax=Halococcus agarilyticus TaxID=1232219 RepID=UPI000677740D|nr:DedA family protein [Halococcus agarilyticus]
MLVGIPIEETATTLLAQYGLLALFVFMFLETSLLFPFVPSELVVPVAAAAIVDGPASFAAFVLVVMAGGTAGSLFAYYVFDAAHQPLVDRYGAYVRVSETDVARARRWFRRYGESSVFWSRLLPVARSVISIPAGIAGMHAGKFAAYSGIGSGLFAAGVAALVVTGREVLPSQLLLGWVTTVLDRAVAFALSNPALAVAAGGAGLFAVLATRNAVADRVSHR